MNLKKWFKKQKNWVIGLISIIIISIFFIVNSVPTGYEIHSSCNCNQITEGAKRPDYFEVINESHIEIHSSTSVISKPSLCTYTIHYASKNRRYSGINNALGLLHYKTPCLSLFIEGIFKDKNDKYYLCKCRI